MAYLYRVEIPFTGVWRHTLDQSGVCKLPSGETLLSDVVVREVSSDRYLSIRELEAPTPTDAKQNAVAIVEKLLQILATNNDLFEIDFSSVTAEVIGESKRSEPKIIATEDGFDVAIHDQVFVLGHISLQKQKAHMNFEARALELLEHWPVHLQRSIELNYSAVRARSHSVGFLLSAAALEVLAWKKLGAPTNVLKTALDSSQRKAFKASFREFAAQWRFDQDQLARLYNNLCNTNNLPVANHLLTYLQSVGLSESFADTTDLSRWWSIRGRLAHGEEIGKEDIQGDFNKLVIAVQTALRQELSVLMSN